MDLWTSNLVSLCLSFVFTYYTQNEHCRGNYSENTTLPTVISSFYLHFLRHMFPIRVLVFCVMYQFCKIRFKVVSCWWGQHLYVFFCHPRKTDVWLPSPPPPLPTFFLVCNHTCQHFPLFPPSSPSSKFWNAKWRKLAVSEIEHSPTGMVKT
jgi:hypothetical protein